MANLIYLCYNARLISPRSRRYVEITTEFLLLLISVILQQLIRGSEELDYKQRNTMCTLILAFLGLLSFINIVFLIQTIILNRRETKRLKKLEMRKKELIEKTKKKVEAVLVKGNENGKEEAKISIHPL